MTYNEYDSKILAPSKCGSRYLDTLYGIKQYNIVKKKTVLPKGTKLNELKPPPKLKEQFFVKEWKEWEIDKLPKIQWIVIRPPEEITISGINTELLLAWNSGTTLLNEERKLVDNILLTKQGHYDPTLFRQLYFFYSTSNNQGTAIKFIHLKDLTEFASEHLNFKEDLSNNVELHDFSNFPIFMSKKDMMEYFKRVYYNEWSTIESNIRVETFFWELIQKNCEFYKPKLSIEDTKNFL
jgi:hypothetical protein